MYHDFGRTKREAWTYSYSGKELLVAVTTKLEEYKSREAKLRKEISSIIGNLTKSVKDSDKLKHELEEVATICEELTVYCHEFERKPEASFSLSLGDVVFFDYPASD